MVTLITMPATPHFKAMLVAGPTVLIGEQEYL